MTVENASGDDLGVTYILSAFYNLAYN